MSTKYRDRLTAYINKRGITGLSIFLDPFREYSEEDKENVARELLDTFAAEERGELVDSMGFLLDKCGEQVCPSNCKNCECKNNGG